MPRAPPAAPQREREKAVWQVRYRGATRGRGRPVGEEDEEDADVPCAALQRLRARVADADAPAPRTPQAQEGAERGQVHAPAGESDEGGGEGETPEVHAVRFLCTGPYFALFDTRPCTIEHRESGFCSWTADVVRAEHNRRAAAAGGGTPAADIVILPACAFIGRNLRGAPYLRPDTPCTEPAGRFATPALELPLAELESEYRLPCLVSVLEVPATRLAALVEWFLNHPHPDMFPHVGGARLRYRHGTTPAPPRGRGLEVTTLLLEGEDAAFLPPRPHTSCHVAVPQSVACGLRGEVLPFARCCVQTSTDVAECARRAAARADGPIPLAEDGRVSCEDCVDAQCTMFV